jgi:hypothetical protein
LWYKIQTLITLFAQVAASLFNEMAVDALLDLDLSYTPPLAIVRESPDFEATYDPVLFMAGQLYRMDPDAARHLLITLEAANPIRQDAKRLQEYLDGIHP